MTTLAIFVERIRRHLSGGFPSIHDRVKDAEIKAQAQSAINRLLRTEVLSTNFNLDGGTIPDGVVIATYDEVAVDNTGQRPFVRLPVMPMYLPERMGLLAIVPFDSDAGEYDYDKEYVPIPPGQYRALSQTAEISSLLGDKAYTWEGLKATLHGHTDDDPAPESVQMKLCVADLGNLEDDDPLPLSPDLEEAVMAAVVQFYTAQPTTPRDEGIEASPRKTDK